MGKIILRCTCCGEAEVLSATKGKEDKILKGLCMRCRLENMEPEYKMSGLQRDITGGPR